MSKETDRKWEEGDDLSILEFKATEYGRARRVVVSEDVRNDIKEIGIKKCAQESGYTRIFRRELLRGLLLKTHSTMSLCAGLRATNKKALPQPTARDISPSRGVRSCVSCW